MNVEPSDQPVIIAALQLQVPDDVAAFLGRMGLAEAEAFVEKVLSQKNSDRVVSAFSVHFAEFNAIEVQLGKLGQKIIEIMILILITVQFINPEGVEASW